MQVHSQILFQWQIASANHKIATPFNVDFETQVFQNIKVPTAFICRSWILVLFARLLQEELQDVVVIMW